MANKVILVGNLGNDPEIKYTDGGTAICTLSVATTERWKNADGEKQEKTEWHRVKIFGKLGEVAAEYLRKGSKVYLEGSMSYGSYEKDGVKHYTADVVLGKSGKMEMLDSKPQEERGEAPSRAPTRAPATRQAPARREPPMDNDEAMNRSREMDPFRDDDIPF
jgi:single-strand DNA-binding protein